MLYFSYPVPNEVGTIGTESSTFIEPISQRKDGILAMFSKQTPPPHTSQSPSSSGSRRPIRPSSNSLGHTKRKDRNAPFSSKKKQRTHRDDGEEHHPPKGKKRSAVIVSRSEDHEDYSDIEIISPPPERQVSFYKPTIGPDSMRKLTTGRTLWALHRLRQAIA